MAAGYFLEKAGMRGGLEIEGSVSGGISVHHLWLESDGTLERLEVGKVVPDYRLSEVLGGVMRGVRIEGVEADLDLAAEKKDKKRDKTEKQPNDIGSLIAKLRDVRKRFVPVDLEVSGIRVDAVKNGESVFALAPSRVRHEAGSGEIRLEIGAVTDPSGREWPSRVLEIFWRENEIRIPEMALIPDFAVTDLLVTTEGEEGPAVSARLKAMDAVFALEAPPGLESAGLDLLEGQLVAKDLLQRIDPELTIRGDARLTSLSVNLERLMPEPSSATGGVRVLFEDVRWEDWEVPELSVDFLLEDGRASIAAGGRALDGGFSLKAAAPIVRDKLSFEVARVEGEFGVTGVAELVTALSERVAAIDPLAPPPPSEVRGTFDLSLSEFEPERVGLAAVLKPSDPEMAAEISLGAGWSKDARVSGRIEAEGFVAEGNFQLDTTVYQGNFTATGFRSARIDPWLAAFRAGTDGGIVASGQWSGSGVVRDATHKGELSLSEVLATVPGKFPQVAAKGGFSYEWPGKVVADAVEVTAADQKILLDARMEGGMLGVSGLNWSVGGRTLATAEAELPVPGDFANWRETIMNDKRPVVVDVKSETIALENLKQWFPAAAKLDPGSSGAVDVKISGSFAEAEVDARIALKGLRSPDQPKVPQADIDLIIAGRGGSLSLDGRVTTPDLPPAVLSASMPFKPAAWAENPDMILENSLTARADLPRIDLARYASLVPSLKRLAGTVNGSVEAAGVLRSPAIRGRIELSGGAVELSEDAVPAVTGIGGVVEATPELVTLRGLKANLSGGSLEAAGTLALADGKPGAMDFRVTGRKIPVLRNDSLVVRTDADLRLAGPFEQALLSGDVGVVDSLFYRDIELLPIGAPFTGPSAAALPRLDAPTQVGPGMSEPFRDWRLDVRARTKNPVLIRGNIASGSVTADLRVGGTFGRPAPAGEVRLTRLKAALPFSTLTVPEGIVRFNESTGLDPILELRGFAEPRPYRVNMFVYGRASDPQLVLTSNPPLPDTEIMTMLATGTTTSGLEDPQAASSRAMQLLAEEMRRGRFAVGKQLRPVLGLLDRVDFSLAEADPYSTDSFSTATLNITDRWLLSAGMGAQGDSRVMGIWRLRFR